MIELLYLVNKALLKLEGDAMFLKVKENNETVYRTVFSIKCHF